MAEVEEMRQQLSTVTNQYQAMLGSLVASATGQTEERVRELSLALAESKLKEQQLTEQMANTGWYITQ